MLSKMRAVVVDDHEAFRSAARRLLEAAGIEVVGTTADLAGGRRLIELLNPDVVLLDVQLPDGNGFDLAEEMATATAATGPLILMTSSRTETGSRITGLRGVVGFVGKDELSVERLHDLLGTP